MVLGKKWPLSLFLVLSVLLPLTPSALAEPSQAASLLAQMTTEEKIAQLLMPAFYYYRTELGERREVSEMQPGIERLLQRHAFGGIIFNLRNAQDNEKAVRLVDAFQSATTSTPGHPQLITCTDQEGGYITRLGKGTQMPGNMALGAVDSVEVTELAARLIGEEVTAIGYSGTFAPVMDVNNDPSNPVIGIRSFSDDPQIVARHGTAFIKGLHDAGSLSTLKHFPGHGDTNTDSHTGLPCVHKTYDELKELELIPFQAGIDAGADLIMTAHIQYPQIEERTYPSIKTGEEIYLPATFSKVILTDMLRGDMGFQGLIVTDAMNMDAVAEHFDPMDAARLAIEAGADLILMPVDTSAPFGLDALEQYIRDVAALADSGTLSMEAVDAAVLRVLSFKESHGMLQPYPGSTIEDQVSHALETVGSAEHHALEEEISKKAVTLLKNETVLPFAPDESIAILLPYTSQVKSAEYAVARAKSSGALDESCSVSVLDIDGATIDDLVKVVQDTRHLIVISTLYSVGDLNPESASGSSSALLDAIITLAHANGNDVTVLSAQLPYDAARWTEADALVVCYGARGMSEDPRDTLGSVTQYGPNVPAALELILSGGHFAGKLPIAIPGLDENYHFTDEILYPRGFGLDVSMPESLPPSASNPE